MDQHSSLYSGSADGWLDWVDRFHAGMTVTRHVVTNILIEVERDEAWSECYWTLSLRMPASERLLDVSAGGRYLDYFRRKDAIWAIQHRRTTNDWDRVDPVIGTARDFEGGTVVAIDPGIPSFEARRDAGDPSYSFLGHHQRIFD